MGGLGYVSDAPLLAWWEETRLQEYEATDFKDLLVIDRVRRSAEDEWRLFAQHRTEASFTFIHLEACRRDLYTLGGFDSDGRFVLERWELFETGPPGQKRFEKTRLVTASLGDRFHGLEFDPEGRFVFVLLGTTEAVSLYRFDARVPLDFAGGARPTVLVDSTSVPELLTMADPQAGTHLATGKRVLCFTPIDLWSDPAHLMFLDVDNDGTFDGPPLVGDAALEEAGLSWTYGNWDIHTGEDE